MESTDSSTTGSQQHQHHQPNLPPGFRFHPTDEELVIHYLKKKATSAPLPVAIIAEVDLYKFDPWELPAKATFGEQEWYFFSPRDRKYPNGARPNRAATSGYWKATGTDKPVLASGGTQKVGVKKALVFYGGKPPKGIKTNWIMHEYRLAETKVCNKPPGFDLGKKNSLRLDDWVLCRIYKKNNAHRSMDPEREDSMDDMMGPIPQSISMGPCLHHQHQLQHHHHHHQNLKFQLPKAATTTATAAATSSSFGALIENDHNFFEGMLNNDSTMSQQFVSSSTTSTQPPPPELNPNNNNSIISPTNNTFSLKRALPPGLYWNDVDEDEAGPSTSKRLQFDNTTDGNNAVLRSSTTTTTTTTTTDGNGNGNGNGPTSIAALLGQLPQTPPLHQQAMLGSLGDGLFRAPPYQLPGMNWYS